MTCILTCIINKYYISKWESYEVFGKKICSTEAGLNVSPTSIQQKSWKAEITWNKTTMQQKEDKHKDKENE